MTEDEGVFLHCDLGLLTSNQGSEEQQGTGSSRLSMLIRETTHWDPMMRIGNEPEPHPGRALSYFRDTVS